MKSAIKPGIVRASDRIYLRTETGKMIRVTKKRRTQEQLDNWMEDFKSDMNKVKERNLENVKNS